VKWEREGRLDRVNRSPRCSVNGASCQLAPDRGDGVQSGTRRISAERDRPGLAPLSGPILLLRVVDRRIQQIPGGNPIDESRRHGRLGADRLAVGAHLERQLAANQPRQALRTAGSRNDAEQHLGLPQPRVARRDPIVAGHRQLEPAAKRMTMNRRDQRLRRVLERQQDPVDPARTLERRIAGLEGVEGLDVGAGDEGRALADQDNRVHRRIRRRARHSIADRLADTGGERVHRRVVDREDGDPAPDLLVHELRHDHDDIW
jgi:hypothetical protein